jgi:hypothetical protein
MVLIFGAAVGLWLLKLWAAEDGGLEFTDWRMWLMAVGAVFVGISMVAVVLLVHARTKSRRRWRAGALCWFCHGVGSWLFAPMVALNAAGIDLNWYSAVAGIYYVYVLPMQGLVVLIGSIVAVRPARGWHRCDCWWPEWFGMWTGTVWATYGVVAVALLYGGEL